MSAKVISLSGGPDPALARVLDSHEAYAGALREDLTAKYGTAPIYALGSLWVAEESLWRPVSPPKLRNLVAAKFHGGKNAFTQRHFAQIADRLCDQVNDPEYFDEVRWCVTAPTSCWTLRQGCLVEEPRSAEQRQRFELPVDPVFCSGKTEPSPPFVTFLQQTFAGDECEERIALLQEIFAGVLFGLIAKFHKAILFYGPTRTGKGTISRILEALLPREAICSVAPHRWGHEYHRAALAGKRLNLVGEVDERNPVPGGDFKSLTGGDLNGARHPNHAAFTFRCEAAHVFSGNAYPEASDRDDAFYGRWLIVEFPNSVAGREDAALSQRLIDEDLPQILGWALEGIERLAKRGRFAPPRSHERLLERWRVEHSSVLTFLTDEQAVALEADAVTPRSQVYERFKPWCKANERRSLGSHTFYAELRRSGMAYGVSEARDARHGWVIRGVRLRNPSDLVG